MKTAGLSETKNPFEKISNLCSYLHVSDLRILSEPDFLVNYRSVISEKEMKNIVNSRAWLQTALNLSKDIKTKPFNCGNLKASLSEIRGMTIQEPEVFIPRLREIFSECGVAFVILPHLKNSGINGAVKWINSDRALLAVNNRGLDADKFWFSLFHEIKHVLQQKVKAVFVMADVTDMTDLDSKYEKEADKFAADFLIPPSEYKKFSPTKFTTDGEIIEFAESIGIHPSIVAARMQHDKIIPQNRCSGLKKKYHIL